MSEGGTEERRHQQGNFGHESNRRRTGTILHSITGGEEMSFGRSLKKKRRLTFGFRMSPDVLEDTR